MKLLNLVSIALGNKVTSSFKANVAVHKIDVTLCTRNTTFTEEILNWKHHSLCSVGNLSVELNSFRKVIHL